MDERRESGMTRIYDALRKAETRRDRLGAAPVAPPPGPDPAAGWPRPGADTTLVPLPLLGGVDMNEDAARETTALRLNLENSLSERVTRSVMFTSAQGGE